ncbi:response regulator [bacterium]|nr:response regulator [bacterium]
MSAQVNISNAVDTVEMTKWNVLVIEDDKPLNSLIQKKLNRAGFKTSGAYNGKEAFEFMSEYPDTLNLLDYRLPDIDGKEFVVEMHKHNLDTPFIVLTGQDDVKIAIEMMKLGARDYLIKDANILDYLPEITKKAIKDILLEQDLIKAEWALRKSEKTLKKQNIHLDQKNAAFREMLSQLSVEKVKIEQQMVANIECMLLPLLERLKSFGQPEDDVYIDLIEKSIEEITSSFGVGLLRKANSLSSREVEICNMIKNGLSTKEIALALIISPRTVEFHRDNIRKKLNIKSKSVCLLSYLKSL